MAGMDAPEVSSFRSRISISPFLLANPPRHVSHDISWPYDRNRSHISANRRNHTLPRRTHGSRRPLRVVASDASSSAATNTSASLPFRSSHLVAGAGGRGLATRAIYRSKWCARGGDSCTRRLGRSTAIGERKRTWLLRPRHGMFLLFSVPFNTYWLLTGSDQGCAAGRMAGW